MHLVEMLRAMWNDDCGAILSTEYVMIGGIVALGTGQGLVALRDGAVAEMKEMSGSMRNIRQSYTTPAPSPAAAAEPATFPTAQQPACSNGWCNLAP